MTHYNHHLIICESRGMWAAALRPYLADAPLALRETRSLAECREELSQFRRRSLLLELTDANLGGVFELLCDAADMLPATSVWVVADRSLARFEGLVREAGALAFASETRRAPQLAQMIQRVAAREPPAELTLTERIEAALPWS